MSGDAGSSAFKKGSIVKITLTNFMTYGHVEVYAGPYLNMVLGPNGTGKSALVCGIIIGMAGEPSATGRSGSLSEYVKFGCNSATTEIELFNPGQNYVIERKLSTTKGKTKIDCKSEWRINSKSVKQMDVKELISELSIRVDNLCQFLPQERVSEFVKMNTKELLENTEKAAGDSDMFKNHVKLQELSKKIAEDGQKLDTLKNHLNVETNLNMRLKEQVKRVREKQDYEENLKWLRLKRPWIEFEQVRCQYQAAKEEVERLQQQLRNLQKKNEPLRKHISSQAVKTDKLEKELKTLNDSIKEMSGKFQNQISVFEKRNEMKSSLISTYEAKKKEEENRHTQMVQWNKDLQNSKEELKNLKTPSGLEKQIREVELKINVMCGQLKACDDEIAGLTDSRDRKRADECALERRINDLKNVYQKRLDLVKQHNPDAYRAARWLETNAGQFTKKIYPPLMTQLNVNCEENAKYLEALIPKRDLYAFICEDISDLRKFGELAEGQQLHINYVKSPDRPANSFKSVYPIERLNSFGFTNFIVDTFTAPESIVSYLCLQYGLHDVPVGDEKVDNAVDAITNSLKDLRRFCSKTSFYTTSISKYDRQPIKTSSRIVRAQLLNLTLNEKALLRLENDFAKCQQGHAELNKLVENKEGQKRQTSDELNSLRSQKNKYLSILKQKQNLDRRIGELELLIKDNESRDIDFESEKNILSDQLEKLSLLQMKNLEQVIAMLESYNCSSSERIQCRLRIVVNRRAKFAAEEKLKQAEAELKSFNDALQIATKTREEKKAEAKDKRHKAMEFTGLKSNAELPVELREKFESLPSDLNEIEDRINEYKLRLSSLMHADDAVINDYTTRKNTIKQKKQQLVVLDSIISESKTELEHIKENWLPGLQSIISRIDANFGQFMSRMGCAGEVVLSHGSDPDQFGEYGITIKVKYRDSELLRPLSSFHQSGGERSVATMIYMMALQELTQVPFRVVDEINQGMDEANERRVFDLIVQSASKNSSQYFLFSPKLLPGLDYSEKMTIHVIFNGPFLRLKHF